MGSVRSAFAKVNRDPAFRAKFLKDPVGILEREGIVLSPRAKKELRSMVPIVKKHLPELSKIPRGYGALIAEVEGRHTSEKTDDPQMLII